MVYFRQLCNNDAVLNLKSQPREGHDEQKGNEQPIRCTQVATERKHRWALPPPVAWVISVLAGSVFFFTSLWHSLCQVKLTFTTVSSKGFSPQQLAEESSIFHMSSEEQRLKLNHFNKKRVISILWVCLVWVRCIQDSKKLGILLFQKSISRSRFQCKTIWLASWAMCLHFMERVRDREGKR